MWVTTTPTVQRTTGPDESEGAQNYGPKFPYDIRLHLLLKTNNYVTNANRRLIEKTIWR